MKTLIAFAAAVCLVPIISACSTTSFAPPSVTIAKPPTPSIADGLALTDNFIESYRKEANALANGRQYYEVPSYLSAFAGLSASVYGSGSGKAVLRAGGIGTLFSAGQAYYAPKSKSAMYDSAIDALSCVQQVATDAKPLTATVSLIGGGTTDEVAYYYLIKNAALKIEDILRKRLSNAGSLTDAEALSAEFEKKIKAATTASTNLAAEKKAGLTATSTLVVYDDFSAKVDLCTTRAKT